MASSQYDEMYATATGTSFKDIMHSTPLAGTPSRQEMPLHYDQFPEPSEHGSDSMSVEMGRGLKRGTSKNYDDMSSNVTFTFGNEHSQYEITGTPPIRSRNNQRKPDGVLRKEASVRRATESGRMREAIRPATNSAKARAVSDNLPRLDVEDEVHEPSLQTATFAIRGSRFTSSRHVSRNYSGIPSRFSPNEGLVAHGQTPLRPATGNPTVQSATHTANQSFMLPDLPNLTELVSGTRADGTPVVRRTGVSRSRFTSASYKPHGQQHLPVTGLPLPEEEKAIFASLQLAGDRIAQLELEKTESRQRAEELECELLELRGRLDLSNGRDSGLGSDEESIELKSSRHEATKLKAKVKALQDRLDKTDRKVSNSEITLSRVSRERNTLVAEVGSAYYQIEELAKENENLQLEVERLSSENAELHEKTTRRSKSQARDSKSTGQVKQSRSTSRHANDVTQEEGRFIDASSSRRSKPFAELRPDQEDGVGLSDGEDEEQYDARSTEQLDQASARSLAARIEQEVQKHRERAAAKTQESRRPTRSNSLRSRSQQRKASTQRREASSRRHTSAPAEVGTINIGLRSQPAESVHDPEDLTVLSDIDTEAVADLRKKLEMERAEGRRKRSSAPPGLGDLEVTVSSNRPVVPRKSSLKDITAGFGEDTARFSVHGATTNDFIKVSKTVRVQSPHSSQDILGGEEQDTEVGDTSTLSNTSRRRRRTSNNEGMTSAFIIPDITMHSTHTFNKGSRHDCIEHKAGSCTVCAASRQEAVDIPLPIPVSERAELADLTDATVRPVQTPAAALATVIKNLEDEIKHLKLARDRQNCRYNQHEPAVSKRKRQSILSAVHQLDTQIETRSDQVYHLYDVLEGQKQQGKELEEQEVEETLTSIGINPAELSGRIGRSAPAVLDDAEGLSGDESDELPWEGLSEVESDEDGGFGK